MTKLGSSHTINSVSTFALKIRNANLLFTDIILCHFTVVFWLFVTLVPKVYISQFLLYLAQLHENEYSISRDFK